MGNKVIGKGKRTARRFMILFLSIVSFLAFFPAIWLTNYSFGKSMDIYAGELLKFPNPIMWENYAAAWRQGRIPQYMFNSIIITGSVVILTVLVTATSAYACSRMIWGARKFYYVLSIMGMMIPVHATLLPNYLIADSLGLLNTFIAIIINYAARNIPFGIMVFSAFLESIPISLEESAVIDGASIMKIVFRIILPLTMPAMMAVGISAFMGAWNDIIMAITFLSKEDMRTIPFSVWRFATLYGADYAKQFAVMVLSTVPMLVIYIIFNEKITSGIMLGAVKA